MQLTEIKKLLTTIYMKKALLLMALMVGCMSASAQKIDKNELKELQAFLSQPAEKHATNAEALKISDLQVTLYMGRRYR